MASVLNWTGVYPAVTTQFSEDLALDVEGTQRVQDAMINDGVDGLIVIGTVGENNSLEADEKRTILRAAKETANGRVPILAGVSELTTKRAMEFARDAEEIGVDGLMVLPAMVYVPTREELLAHFRAVARASGLPIMLYNNPPAYRVSLAVGDLKALAQEKTIVAIKESAPDSRRFTDIINAVGDDLHILAGLDDMALEGNSCLGRRDGCQASPTPFPLKSVALVKAACSGDLETARNIYRWFMPLLHLDAEHDLVQSIKLAEQIMGRGSERVRMPRMPLAGARRAEVTALVEQAAATRPVGARRRVA